MTATRPPGGSVFLVEDEVMIRMMVADMLEELGYSVAAEAGEINEAIRLAQSTEFDLAILDVNVNGKVISPVAELIKARNRPFIFATGYGSSGLPEEYRDRPALQKPFQLETLARMIESALKGATVFKQHRCRPGAKSRDPYTESRCCNTAALEGRGVGPGLLRMRRYPYFSVAVSACENSSSVRSSRSGVTET